MRTLYKLKKPGVIVGIAGFFTTCEFHVSGWFQEISVIGDNQRPENVGKLYNFEVEISDLTGVRYVYKSLMRKYLHIVFLVFVELVWLVL